MKKLKTVIFGLLLSCGLFSTKNLQALVHVTEKTLQQSLAQLIRRVQLLNSQASGRIKGFRRVANQPTQIAPNIASLQGVLQWIEHSVVNLERGTGKTPSAWSKAKAAAGRNMPKAYQPTPVTTPSQSYWSKLRGRPSPAPRPPTTASRPGPPATSKFKVGARSLKPTSRR